MCHTFKSTDCMFIFVQDSRICGLYLSHQIINMVIARLFNSYSNVFCKQLSPWAYYIICPTNTSRRIMLYSRSHSSYIQWISWTVEDNCAAHVSAFSSIYIMPGIMFLFLTLHVSNTRMNGKTLFKEAYRSVISRLLDATKNRSIRECFFIILDFPFRTLV